MDGRRGDELRAGRVRATGPTPMPTRVRRGLAQDLRPRDALPVRLRPVVAEGDDAVDGEGVGLHFIEIELVDMNDQPVVGERYRIELPDGTVRQGTLDGRGRARIDRLRQAGTCKVSFPRLDQDAWEGIAG